MTRAVGALLLILLAFYRLPAEHRSALPDGAHFWSNPRVDSLPVVRFAAPAEEVTEASGAPFEQPVVVDVVPSGERSTAEEEVSSVVATEGDVTDADAGG